MTTPERIGRYEILSRVAAGGQATVYRVQDSTLGRVVALKVLHPHLSDDAQFLERFVREARVAAAISHPNAVVIYEVGEDAGRHFIAMEYLPQSLHDLLTDRAPLSVDEAIDLVRPVALALDVAHQGEVIHRDLKPRNILISEDGVPKVTDFGIARAAEFATMTATGLVMGTPAYMSPEQAKGERVDARTDVYALGVILFEALTAHVPLEGLTPQEVMRHHFLGTETPLEQLDAVGIELDAEVRDLLRRVLAIDPDDRPASAGAFAEALDTLTRPVPADEVVDDTEAPIDEEIELLYCPNCGVATNGNTRYCGICGIDLSSPLESAPVVFSEVPDPVPQHERRTRGQVPWLWLLGPPGVIVALAAIMVVAINAGGADGGADGGAVPSSAQAVATPIFRFVQSTPMPSIVYSAGGTTGTSTSRPAPTQTQAPVILEISTRTPRPAPTQTQAPVNLRISTRTPLPAMTQTPVPVLAPTPWSTSTSVPAPMNLSYGPTDGSFQHMVGTNSFYYGHGSDSFYGHVVRIDQDSVAAEVKFFNPYSVTNGGSWSYGFLVEDQSSRPSERHAVIVEGAPSNAGAWSHWVYSSKTNSWSPKEGNDSMAIDISMGGGNQIRLLNLGGESWLIVNGVFLARLQMLGLGAQRKITTFANFHPFDGVEGSKTRYEGLRLRAFGPKYGPESGSLASVGADVVEERFSNVTLSDFAITATFANPYSLSEALSQAHWSHGFVFRATPDTFFTVGIRSKRIWAYALSLTNERTEVEEHFNSAINTDGGENRLRLLAFGNYGWLFINGELASVRLDLSRFTDAGDIGVASGIWVDDGIVGKQMEFRDFMVWGPDEDR